MNDYLFSGVLLLSALAAGWFLYVSIAILLKRGLRFIYLKGFKLHLEYLKPPLRLLIPVFFVSAVFSSLLLPPKSVFLFSHLIHIVLIASFGWAAVKIIHILRDSGLERYNINVKDNARARGMHTQIRLMANIIIILVIIFTVALILMTFPEVRQVGLTILASAGIIGIVIGFAAQKTLGNLIAGIQIAITQPIRIDDVVIVENEWGKIEEITLTYVVVRVWDLRRLIVPIGYFLEKPFQNWTRTSADLLGSVMIFADYTVPVKEIRIELTNILKNSPLWDRKVNVLQLTDMNEKAIQLRALMSAEDASILWDLRCEVREKLLEFLQKKFPECLPRVRLVTQA